MQLVQMDQENGLLGLVSDRKILLQLGHHFLQQTISLVLEEQEMIC